MCEDEEMALVDELHTCNWEAGQGVLRPSEAEEFRLRASEIRFELAQRGTRYNAFRAKARVLNNKRIEQAILCMQADEDIGPGADHTMQQLAYQAVLQGREDAPYQLPWWTKEA